MMRILLLGCCLAALPAFPEVMGRSQDADREWSSMEARGLFKRTVPEGYAKMSWRDLSEELEQRALQLRREGEKFCQSYPTDSRRWWVIWRMINNPPTFVISYGPTIETNHRDFAVDTARAASWNAELERFRVALNSASDVPFDLREEMAGTELQNQIQAASNPARGAQVAWPELALRVHDLGERFPNGQWAYFVAVYLMRAYLRAEPDAALQDLEKLAQSSNAQLASYAARTARETRAFRQIFSRPLDITFVALDGRRVDTGTLRGKVVLVDFWATWCGPCMEEMPYIRKAYADYHDKGLEIIGVSCDVAPGTEGPYAKRAKTAAEVLEFARKEGMPWPHYYDGKKHGVPDGNALAATFAVTGIPATFLFDRDGKLAAKGLRGTQLLQAIERVLAGEKSE